LCGGTRAVVSLGRGEIVSALEYNAAVTVVALVLILSLVACLLVMRSLTVCVEKVRKWLGRLVRAPLVTQVVVFGCWWLWNVGRW
jgi:hypothetical protein